MGQKINEPVSVSLIFDYKNRRTRVSRVLWKNRIYKITKQGLRHTYRKGSNTFHIFSVASNTISFRLVLDSSSLIWILEEIYDPNIK